MRLEAAIRGDLQKIMKQEAAAAEKAVTLGVTQAATGLRDELKSQVLRAGPGGVQTSFNWQAVYDDALSKSVTVVLKNDVTSYPAFHTQA